MSHTIPLTKGRFAVVEDADFARLSQLKWCYNSSGYAVHYEDRRTIFMHRLIMNAPPHLQVDHINQNRLDNRRENLRFATRSQNQANKGRQVNNTSGYKGVSFRAGKWEARIRVAGGRLQLGRFDDPVTAALIYDAASRLFNVDFAGVNFPERPTSPEIDDLLDRLPRKKTVPATKEPSKYRGVGWATGRWRARICVAGKRLDLGCFDDEASAARAYDAAAICLGVPARLNFPIPSAENESASLSLRLQAGAPKPAPSSDSIRHDLQELSHPIGHTTGELKFRAVLQDAVDVAVADDLVERR